MKKLNCSPRIFKKCFIVAFSCIYFAPSYSQDTFSIVAVDSLTGEVGSAGASCVDMFNLPGYTTDFLGDLIPGVGAINTQASYLPANQTNARNRMNAGDTPSQIISWLAANDAQSNSGIRQYGIAELVNGSPQAAAYTGANCMNYKNHITGNYYSIQGNILLGQQVLDSMEARFLNEQGDLACKLMAALQGAKMIGADTRCATDGTSSLFAFVKVSLPSDPYGSPSFLVSVKTHDNSGIEPIDTLQTLFNAAHSCLPSGMPDARPAVSSLLLYPNPSAHSLTVKFTNPGLEEKICAVRDIHGRKILETKIHSGYVIDMEHWQRGVYFLEVQGGVHNDFFKIVRQ